MKIFEGNQNFKRLLASLVLITLALIFIQSELVALQIHKDHGKDQDYCKLVSQTIQDPQEDFQKFDTVINFPPLQKDPVIFFINSTCFNKPINLIQRHTPLILMIGTFLI